MRILRLRIGPGWPEDGMRKWEVISARALWNTLSIYSPIEMPICSTCGNEIEDRGSCPHCGGWSLPIGKSGRRQPKPGVVTINLERGRPTVEMALSKLDREIATARMSNSRLLRVIHGWGSSGEGGAIRTAVLGHLASLLRSRRVRGFLNGLDYSRDTNQGRTLLARFPVLEDSLKSDRDNAGVTFIEF